MEGSRETEMKTQAERKTAVLIGAGEMHGNAMHGNALLCITEAAAGADMVIALDGGLSFCEENGIIPDHIIGDFDSLAAEKLVLLKKYPQSKILRLPCQKDDTDMLAAIRFGMENKITDFYLYGGLGGRISHSIANIQCLAFLKEKGLMGRLIGDRCEILLIQNESLVLDRRHSGMISVFAYGDPAGGVCIKGLKYELEDSLLTTAFPIGVSNEFIGKEAVISVRNGTLLIILEK